MEFIDIDSKKYVTNRLVQPHRSYSHSFTNHFVNSWSSSQPKRNGLPMTSLKANYCNTSKNQKPGNKILQSEKEEAGIPNKNDGPTRNTKRYTPLPSVASEFDGLIRWGFNSDGSEPAAQGPYYTGAGQREGINILFWGGWFVGWISVWLLAFLLLFPWNLQICNCLPVHLLLVVLLFWFFLSIWLPPIIQVPKHQPIIGFLLVSGERCFYF